METQVRQLQQQLDDSRTQSKQEMHNVRRRLDQEKKKLNQANEVTVSQACYYNVAILTLATQTAV